MPFVFRIAARPGDSNPCSFAFPPPSMHNVRTTKEPIMKEQVYSDLCRHLDKHLLGAPETGPILEILRILFTPEEAELGLKLNPIPEALSKLAASAGMHEDELRPTLEEMADKGLVFKTTISEKDETRELYSLLPTAPGLWEMSFARGEKNARTEKLARLWREYYEAGWGNAMHRGKTPLTRILPVESSVSSDQEVLPYERLSELIRQKDYAAVIHCACRKAAELDGKGCGKPTDVCLHFGDLARFWVDRDYAREVSIDEALRILERSEKAGLVHLTANSQAMGLAICSCCSCCCAVLRALTEIPKPGAVAGSRFVPVLDPGACTSCEDCVERCQVQAIRMIEELPDMDRQKCIGCGLCVTGCPAEALSLEEREAYARPVASVEELAMTMIMEKGQ